jgi:Na+-driven multidrug efflux pump
VGVSYHTILGVKKQPSTGISNKLPKSNPNITTKRINTRIDLTAGPILKTLISLAVPVTISMVMFTIYLLVDLYFVGRLGPDAVAALSISSNAFFIHLGFSTILGTGGMALIAQAFGRKDHDCEFGFPGFG